MVVPSEPYSSDDVSLPCIHSRWLLPVSRRRGQTTRPYLPSQARAEEAAEAAAKGQQDNPKTSPKKVSNTSVRKRVEAFYKKGAPEDTPQREDSRKGAELKKVAELRRAVEGGTKKKDSERTSKSRDTEATSRKEVKRKHSDSTAKKSPDRSPRKRDQTSKKETDKSPKKEVTYTSKKDIPLSPTRSAPPKRQESKESKASVGTAPGPPPGRPPEDTVTGKADIGLHLSESPEPDDSDMSRRTDFSSASSRLGSYRPLGSRDYTRPTTTPRYDYRSSPGSSRSDYRSSPQSEYRASPIRTEYTSSISSVASRGDYSPAALRAQRPEFAPAEITPRSPAARTRSTHQVTPPTERREDTTDQERRGVARVELTLQSEGAEKPVESIATERPQRERLKVTEVSEPPVLAERSTSVSTGPGPTPKDIEKDTAARTDTPPVQAPPDSTKPVTPTSPETGKYICSPFYWRGLTLIPVWISNHMPSKVWYKITHPFLNFNCVTVEV